MDGDPYEQQPFLNYFRVAKFQADDQGVVKTYLAIALAYTQTDLIPDTDKPQSPPYTPERIHFRVTVRSADNRMTTVQKFEFKREEGSKVWDLQPLTVIIKPYASVMFSIHDPDGKPIEDAKVKPNKSEYFPSDPFRVINLGSGNYRIPRLTHGLDYSMTISKEGFQTVDPITLPLMADKVHDIGIIELQWWGSKGVPRLIRALGSADETERGDAASVLGSFGTASADAVPVLVDLLQNDPSSYVRNSAASALGEIGSPARVAVPALIKVMKEGSDEWIRCSSVAALGQLGDRSALPAMEEVHKSADVRAAIISERGDRRAQTQRPARLNPPQRCHRPVTTHVLMATAGHNCRPRAPKSIVNGMSFNILCPTRRLCRHFFRQLLCRFFLRLGAG